jgi:hypothetical protein
MVSALAKASTIQATDTAAAGMSTYEMLTTANTGAQALNTADYLALGGDATSDLVKGLLIDGGLDVGGSAYQLTTTPLQQLGTSLSLAGTGLTGLADAGAGVGSGILSAGAAGANAYATK